LRIEHIIVFWKRGVKGERTRGEEIIWHVRAAGLSFKKGRQEGLLKVIFRINSMR
jgi:hypothetical protein